MNKTIIGIIVAVIVIGGGFWYVKSTRAPQSTEPIKIGIVAPLSGAQANYGTGVKEGIDLALKEWGDKKIKGRSVVFIYEDSRSEVASAVSAAQKLISIDKVSAIVAGGASQEAVALIPVVTQAQVPMVAAVSQAPELSPAGPYVFRMLPEIASLAERIATYARAHNYKRAAVITAAYNQAAVAAAQKFSSDFQTKGGTMVSDERFEKGLNDFRSDLNKIKQTNPDVIFLNALTAEAGIILKQQRELGIVIPVISQGAVEDKKVVEVSGPAAEGLVFATFNPVAPDAFVSKVQAAYGFEPRRWNSEGYETALFVLKGLGEAKTFDALGVQKGFAQVRELDGVASKLQFDAEGNISRPALLKKIQNGEFVLVEE